MELGMGIWGALSILSNSQIHMHLYRYRYICL